jgi:hypothetical protein
MESRELEGLLGDLIDTPVSALGLYIDIQVCWAVVISEKRVVAAAVVKGKDLLPR